MNKVLLPCPFCGGEAIMKIQKHIPKGYEYTPTCKNTSCAGRLTKKWLTEAEAIEAWNRRVVTDTNDGSKERTAKVRKHEYRIGTSLNIVGEPKICHEYLCCDCKKKVLSGDDYCSHVVQSWIGVSDENETI